MRSAFLPWHRLFLRLQEMLLQNECGYKGALPYWDEQRDLEVLGSIENASVWGSDEFSFGTNGVNTTDGVNCVIDGAFANTTLRMDQIWGVDYYDEYCLSREWNQTAWEFANQTNVDICFAKDNYNEANFCYVDSPHSCGHLATGGTVSLFLTLLYESEVTHISSFRWRTRMPALATLFSSYTTPTWIASGRSGRRPTSPLV